MSTPTDPTIKHVCIDCGRNISYFFGSGEPVPDDAMCVLCMIQGFCKGDCGAHTDDVMLFDIRVLTRVWMVLEMIHGLSDSLDVTKEMYDAGKTPKSGLDRDLSEHHLGTGILDILDAASQEMMAAFRRLCMSLLDARDLHAGETWFAVNHHPAGAVVVREWERTS